MPASQAATLNFRTRVVKPAGKLLKPPNNLAPSSYLETSRPNGLGRESFAEPARSLHRRPVLDNGSPSCFSFFAISRGALSWEDNMVGRSVCGRAPAACLVVLAGMAVCAPVAWGAAVVRTGSGPNAAAITGVRDQFRADLGGGTVAGANGLFQDASGARREINWDGVPDVRSAPNDLPADFFNVTSPRGAVFSTPGSGFQVSATAASGTPVRFGNLFPAYASDFAAFSAERLFTALGSNITDVTFFVPGTTSPATVTGFGAVFSDVDRVDSTTIEYFTPGGASLGVFTVPVGETPGSAFDGNLSFLGVSFNGGEQVGRVRITSGNGALGANFPDADLVAGFDPVVMDDFLYTNPVPEPAALAPWLMGGVLLLLRRRSI
jgi:hypothetical protein